MFTAAYYCCLLSTTGDAVVTREPGGPEQFTRVYGTVVTVVSQDGPGFTRLREIAPRSFAVRLNQGDSAVLLRAVDGSEVYCVFPAARDRKRNPIPPGQSTGIRAGDRVVIRGWPGQFPPANWRIILGAALLLHEPADR